ncbi:hypothetical protein M513_08252, partial [Trichuris suis]
MKKKNFLQRFSELSGLASTCRSRTDASTEEFWRHADTTALATTVLDKKLKHSVIISHRSGKDKCILNNWRIKGRLLIC